MHSFEAYLTTHTTNMPQHTTTRFQNLPALPILFSLPGWVRAWMLTMQRCWQLHAQITALLLLLLLLLLLGFSFSFFFSFPPFFFFGLAMLYTYVHQRSPLFLCLPPIFQTSSLSPSLSSACVAWTLGSSTTFLSFISILERKWY
ncbi:uncharacterized protein IWZ02DRAFT_55247 [Phyllosticta citriasiana]|uniref:uncharacterized protein n=1 Tax=Phyllosticta citriasiana TaxID=595635 RepID=UPI0030FD60AA